MKYITLEESLCHKKNSIYRLHITRDAICPGIGQQHSGGHIFLKVCIWILIFTAEDLFFFVRQIIFRASNFFLSRGPELSILALNIYRHVMYKMQETSSQLQKYAWDWQIGCHWSNVTNIISKLSTLFGLISSHQLS